MPFSEPDSTYTVPVVSIYRLPLVNRMAEAVSVEMVKLPVETMEMLVAALMASVEPEDRILQFLTLSSFWLSYYSLFPKFCEPSDIFLSEKPSPSFLSP